MFLAHCRIQTPGAWSMMMLSVDSKEQETADPMLAPDGFDDVLLLMVVREERSRCRRSRICA